MILTHLSAALGCPHGFLVDFFELLRTKMNFTLQFIRADRTGIFNNATG